MNYQINVSLNGTYYFSTREDGLAGWENAIKVYKDFLVAFPKEKGFKVELYELCNSSKKINVTKSNLQHV